ncbi:MAG TPA: hypothetical protein VMB50_17050 [Myxococcales bacterium]|nr:hypothetical protein [Myxococcales bacterium]
MADWKPLLDARIDLRGLPLTAEEGFVASRLDGATGVRELGLVTGLPPEKIAAALDKLVSLGAVAKGGDAGAKGAPPAALRAEPLPEPTPEAPPEADEREGEPTQEEEASTGTHRQLFETTLRALPGDERASRATAAGEPELSALCFDPLFPVIRALLDNPGFGLPQARLVAAHHHTALGLEALGARAAFAADAGVRRALLRNPQLPAGLMRRLFGGRRLLEQYQLTVSREIPEQTRRIARELLRARFTTADADERVELILKTEGRCLTPLTGLPVDGKTAARLCARTFTSTLLVQNVARWAAAPPTLIAHLLRQELVRRSPALRALLLRHPNAPSDANR